MTSASPPTPSSSSTDVTVYYLDERDVIVDVNAAWNDFALQNGGILLADDCSITGRGG